MNRQKVVEIATNQVGIKGAPNKFTTWYGSIGGTTSYAWCVVFIAWCFSQAGLKIFPRTAGVQSVLDYAEKNNYFKSKSSGYTPVAGDIMIQQSGGASHVGIVTGAGSGCFYTIEGNYSKSVAKVTRSYDSKLTGFFVPPFSASPGGSGGGSASTHATDSADLPKDPVLIDDIVVEKIALKDDFTVSRDETHKIFADGVDITKYIGGLSWENNIAELATTMSFDIAKTDAQYMNLYLPQPGSIVNLYTNVEIFRGIVLSMDDGDWELNRYTAVDFGWYLNKSQETYQFNRMAAHKAISKMCGDFDIKVDSLPPLDAPITKIYFDKTISEIIDDILELCGGAYNYDMTPKGLRIYKLGDIIAYPEFKLSPNTQKICSPSVYGGKSHTLDISELKNSIKVITDKDSVTTVKTVVRDADSIHKYGLLQEIVKVDLEKENPDTVGKATLNELNRVDETFSIEIIEALDSYTRAGSLIVADNVFYLIEGARHSIQNGIHRVNLDLRGW